MKRIFQNEIVRFLLIGGCSTIIDFLAYMALSNCIDITVSKGISMSLASVFSYFANKHFTFRVKEKTNWMYLLRFYFIFALNLLANTFTNFLAFKITGWKIVAFVVATICGMTVNYLGQKLIVFGRKDRVGESV